MKAILISLLLLSFSASAFAEIINYRITASTINSDELRFTNIFMDLEVDANKNVTGIVFKTENEILISYNKKSFSKYFTVTKDDSKIIIKNIKSLRAKNLTPYHDEYMDSDIRNHKDHTYYIYDDMVFDLDLNFTGAFLRLSNSYWEEMAFSGYPKKI